VEDSAAARTIFEFLTATDWCGGGCGVFDSWSRMPLTCRKLRFLRRGELREWAYSDVSEGDQTGSWNFALEGDSAGIVFFGGHSLIRFVREGDTLRFGGGTQRCPRPAQVMDSLGFSRDRLPSVSAPRLLASLCGHDWFKEDDLNLFMDPQTLHFDTALGCRMGFRDGACVQTGRFSIEMNELVLEMSTPGCDVRESANLFANAREGAEVVGDTLTFDGNSYTPVESRRSLRRARGLGNQGSLVMDLEYEGPFEAGKPKRVVLRFVNRPRSEPGRTIRLGDLTVTSRRLRPTGSGLSPAGADHPLVHHEYQDREIPPGGSWTDSLSLVVPDRGEHVEILFAWNCRDATQSYHPMAWPITRVR